MNSKEDRALARKKQAEQARELYDSGLTLMQVVDEMGVSYGKVHALVKEAGGVIRPRGHRWAVADAPADDVDGGDPGSGEPQG